MSIDELIQLMRTCSMAEIRLRLMKLEQTKPEEYTIICKFYRTVVDDQR